MYRDDIKYSFYIDNKTQAVIDTFIALLSKIVTPCSK